MNHIVMSRRSQSMARLAPRSTSLLMLVRKNNSRRSKKISDYMMNNYNSNLKVNRIIVSNKVNYVLSPSIPSGSS